MGGIKWAGAPHYLSAIPQPPAPFHRSRGPEALVPPISSQPPEGKQASAPIWIWIPRASPRAASPANSTVPRPSTSLGHTRARAREVRLRATHTLPTVARRSPRLPSLRVPRSGPATPATSVGPHRCGAPGSTHAHTPHPGSRRRPAYSPAEPAGARRTWSHLGDSGSAARSPTPSQARRGTWSPRAALSKPSDCLGSGHSLRRGRWGQH